MLSTASKYALRALTELARWKKGDAMRGQELAECTAIPPQYLAKIMTTLRNGGFVATTRGSGGGYRLAKSANAIALIEVMELFDGPSARPECFLGLNDKCDPASPCSAHASWGALRAMYIGFLEHTMLSEIARAPRLPLGLDGIKQIGAPQ